MFEDTTDEKFESVDIGRRKLRYICRGARAQIARICLYDRANLGKSDTAPTPRTMRDMANDLHALLRNANIKPPK